MTQAEDRKPHSYLEWPYVQTFIAIPCIHHYFMLVTFSWSLVQFSFCLAIAAYPVELRRLLA